MAVHEPVMTREVLSYLAPERGGLFVDCTVGLGGHAKAILEHGATGLIGMDRDQRALEVAESTLQPWRDRVVLVHSDFRAIEDVFSRRGVTVVDGGLADLGMSSFQLEGEGRGFSFQREDPLDMRMDTSTGSTAAELLRNVREEDLADVIFRFGEERYSRRIARAIVRARTEAPITTTTRLASLVRGAVPRRGFSKIDPATRTFQALRIWVNSELDGLDRFVTTLTRRLRVGARMVVITFHSLEDRIVKHTMRALAQEAGGSIRVLTKKPVMAQPDEIERNPRARSAKLRVVERIVASGV